MTAPERVPRVARCRRAHGADPRLVRSAANDRVPALLVRRPLPDASHGIGQPPRRLAKALFTARIVAPGKAPSVRTARRHFPLIGRGQSQFETGLALQPAEILQRPRRSRRGRPSCSRAMKKPTLRTLRIGLHLHPRQFVAQPMVDGRHPAQRRALPPSTYPSADPDDAGWQAAGAGTSSGSGVVSEVTNKNAFSYDAPARRLENAAGEHASPPLYAAATRAAAGRRRLAAIRWRTTGWYATCVARRH